MREPTVAAGVVEALIQFATSRGADETSLLRDAKVDREQLADRDNRLPLSQYIALTTSMAKVQ